MIDYLTNLVTRICDRSEQLHNGQTVSWQALREAEQLANHAYIPVLYQYIETEPQKEKRIAAAFIITQLSRNTNDPEVIRFLMDRLKAEQDTDIVTAIQQNLESGLPVPGYINLQPLFNNTLSANNNVRRSALLALRGTNNPAVEEWALNLLKRTVNDYDVYYIVLLLHKTGTQKSLPVLRRLLEHSRQDVKALAFATIADIEKEKEAMFYMRCLQRGHLKFEAMEAIYKYADESAIQAVIGRITELLSKRRSNARLTIETFKNGFTDLMLGMEFLSRFRAAKAEVKKTFSWITETRADYLLPEEREWIQRNLPSVAMVNK
ncbi:HEAT repeat domain-containing protein [Chitinophaga solisilvae]|uniref:HEAT repeat domain-containing protein n=1 Tax=Chitinophaga solisilvae TaxID=1233460 RepID=A0A9Q5GVU7_9BACT|nr:HEAT repeat domain-containing protein [Chitinophaga solisilvae]NSL87413.1 HEAT repeat domain-containing protein [Chitinophaga solisilvae]